MQQEESEQVGRVRFSGESGLRAVSSHAAWESADQPANRFFGLSVDLLCIAGFDGYFKIVNPTWEKTLGFSGEELLAKPRLEFVHPEDRNATAAEEAKLRNGADALSFENRYLCKDGSYRWLSWTATALPAEELIYAAAREITNRKRAQAGIAIEHQHTQDELRRAHAELEAIQIRAGELAQSNKSLQAKISEDGRAELQIMLQQEVIRELSTPVLQVRPRLLIVPLIGQIDGMRARQLTDELLAGIRANRAKVVVIDFTGVPAVDSRVANHLLKTVQAARLLGASVIVTGLSRQATQTLVTLGVELTGMSTLGDLQSGIEEAERILGCQVVPIKPKAEAA